MHNHSRNNPITAFAIPFSDSTREPCGTPGTRLSCAALPAAAGQQGRFRQPPANRPLATRVWLPWVSPNIAGFRPRAIRVRRAAAVLENPSLAPRCALEHGSPARQTAISMKCRRNGAHGTDESRFAVNDDRWGDDSSGSFAQRNCQTRSEAAPKCGNDQTLTRDGASIFNGMLSPVTGMLRLGSKTSLADQLRGLCLVSDVGALGGARKNRKPFRLHGLRRLLQRWADG